MKKKVSGRQRILQGVFILMAIVCVIIVSSAFLHNVYSNYKITSLLTQVSDNIDQFWNNISCDEIEHISNLFIEKLRGTAEHSMESNTVTFLLTVLSAGVIGYAIFLLDHSRKTMADIDEKIAKLTQQAKETYDFLDTGVALWRTGSWLSKAKVMNALLQSQKNKRTFENIVPKLQDLLWYIYVDLQDTTQRTGPVESSQRQSFREITQDLKSDFEGVPDSYQHYVKALIDYCNKILDLLKA